MHYAGLNYNKNNPQKIHSINYTSSEPQFVNLSTAECFSIDYHGEKHSEVEKVTEEIINF